MRRPLTISLAAALIAIGLLAVSARASTASPASPAIICPLVFPPIGPCCGPPIVTPAATSLFACCAQAPGALCCPPGAACVVPMTISSAPNPSVAGSAVTISGLVTGVPVGTVVVLWQELPGQKGFQKIAQTTTNASSMRSPRGAYTVRLGAGKVRTNRAWYIASGGGKSFTIAQVVTAKVTISAQPGELSHGHEIILTGKVDPAHGGQRVRLEQKVSGTWRVLSHVRLSKKSRYTVSHRWSHGGVVKLRIALPADKLNAASLSPAARVTLPG